jgi:hypothetical protein
MKAGFGIHEKHHYTGLHRVQAEKLLDDKKQEDHAGSPGAEEVLQILPGPHDPQRNKVISSRGHERLFMEQASSSNG